MCAHRFLMALCAGISLFLVPAASAVAASVTVDVRIEGAHETLFEGPLAVAPHGVRASSDTNPKLRSCNGINSLDPGNAVPGPTPTSSSADAMAAIGETFDGKWYPGFDDYFITRWGPDREAEGKSWGILVNDTFTSVGGCQYQLDEGDEVLWVFNAFDNRPNLALFPEGYPAGARPLTATAVPGRPFKVEVVAFEDDLEDTPPAHPERIGSVAYPGAYVSPVTTDPKGFERVDTGSPASVVTNSAGKAQITFTTPGWHRIKAAVPGHPEEEAIRSNRLDVCVPEAGQSDCGALPADDEVRVPPPTVGEEEEPGGGGGGSGGEPPDEPGPSVTPAIPGAADSRPPVTTRSQAPPGAAAPSPGALRVSVPRLDRRRLKHGRLRVSWRVLEAGAGVASWTIASRTLGHRHAPYVRRAGGAAGTSTSLRLPRGAAYRLRFTITDALGQSSNLMIGKVVVPGGGRS